MTIASDSTTLLIKEGQSLAASGDTVGAVETLKKAVLDDPSSLQARFALGTQFYQMGDNRRAVKHFLKAAALSPDTPEVWNNLGAALGRLGKASRAIWAFHKVCELDPNHAAAAMNLGRLLLRQGKAEEAEQWLRQSDLVRPHHSITLRVLADARLALGQPRMALRAADAAVAADPEDIWAVFTQGKANLALRRLDIARKAFEDVCAVMPGHPEALYYLGETEEKAGNIEVARALFDRVLESDIDPEFRTLLALKRALALPVIATSEKSIQTDRSRIEDGLTTVPKRPIADPYLSGGFTNFYLAYHGCDDRALQEKIAAHYLSLTPALGDPAQQVSKRTAGPRLKIGVVSSFLRSHTVGYLCRGLIEHLDRERFHVTLFRAPVLPLEDPVAPAIAASADAVVDLPDDLPRARAAIADVQADLLYFPEIGMEDLVYFLAFARLAPVQVMGWGHPVTSGIPNVDVFLSVADMEPDNGADHYSERLVALDGLSLCVDPPGDLQPDLGKSEFGIDPNVPSYVCAQSLFKVHPEFDTTLAALLDRDPTGKLYFLSVGTNADDVFRDRIAKVLGPNMARVEILPRVRSGHFVAFLKAADVLLDVPHWSGGKTSLESLWAGTPIVHWPGAFMRGRHTLAFYRRMGVLDCVVDSSESYVETAYRLVHDQPFRTSVRSRIAATVGTLFNDKASIDEISDVFEALIAESR